MNQSTTFGYSEQQLAIQQAFSNVPTPQNDLNPLQCANVQYVLDHQGGGGSTVALNITNDAYPLTGQLTIDNQAVIVRTPQSNSECANALYVQNQVQIEQNARISADDQLQDNIDTEQNERESADQGLQDNIDQLADQVYKRYPLFQDKTISTYNAQTIDSLIGGTSQPLNVTNNAYPLTGQLVLTTQPVLVGTPLLSSQAANKQYVDQLVIAEANARTSADNTLQDNIDTVSARSLNEIDNLNPLTANLDLSDSQFKLRVANPSLPLDVTNKFYVDSVVGQITTNKIVANGDPTSQLQIYQGGTFTDIQGVTKQELDVQKMVSYVPIRYSEQFEVTGNYQLATTEQVNVVQQNLQQEATDRASADQGILDTPLNQWPAGFDGNLNMQGSQITNLTTLDIGASQTDAANCRYVGAQIANQNLITVGLIASAVSQANGYTDNAIADTRISDLLAPNATVSMAYNRIRLLEDPINDQDAANKQWTLAQITSGTSASLAQINAAFPSTDATLNLSTCSSVKVPTATDTTDAVNLQQTQQLITSATSLSLVDINQNNPSTGQILNLQGVDVRVESQDITSVNNPVSIQYMSDQLANYYPTSTTINQIALATSSLDMNAQKITNLAPGTNPSDAVRFDQLSSATGDRIQNASQSAVVTAESGGNVSIKTNGASGSLVVSQVNNNYTIANNNNIQLQTNGILTLNAGQYTQSTTPIYSNSTANQSANQLLNRQQNDARYYQNTTRINDIQSATGNITMNGFTLSNIRDAVDILEPTNLAQVTSLIANSGFKNKIQSQSNHAQVICDQGSDIVEIKANNADSNIVIQATGSDYTIGNTGEINLQASELNVNQNALRVLGNSGQASILLAGDLRSTALDLDLPDQILTREQNDARYLSQTTTLSSIPAPDASVSFGNQLLRNLQNPIVSSDASTKAYIDNSLLNYPTTESVQANFLTKSNAAATYQTSSQVDSQISTALLPYSNTTQMNSAILTALVPYRLLTNPDDKIRSTDSNTQLLAQTGSQGVQIKANGNNIGRIYQAIGQTGFTPLVLQATDKLQFVADAGSTSFTSGTGDTTNGVYIASASDNTSQFCWDQLVVGSGSNRLGLVLSSGHTDGNVPYNAISANTTGSLQNLTITPETSLVASQGGNQLTMYGNAVAGLFPIQNQFNKPVGRTSTQSSALANEFLTKGLADTLYTGGSGGAQIVDSGSNNSVTCTASNPGIIVTNLKNILTSLQLGSATSSGSAIAFQSASGAVGGINALSGNQYIEHISNGQGFKFMNNLGSGYMFLKSAAKASTDGTSQVVFVTNPQVNSGQTNPLSNELIQAQYADARYTFKDTTLNNLTAPSANLSMNNFLITNLASGTIASGNTSSVTGANVYDYISTLPSVITQQVYTVTVQGSTTNGFQWTAFTNTAQTGTVQCQRVKGSGAQMITSSVITSQSQTLVPDFTTLQFQVANANIRVTQVVPYTLTTFTSPGQQNIASMTFSQQAISSTATCVQLYKPQGNQGGAAFILYVYVDQF